MKSNFSETILFDGINCRRRGYKKGVDGYIEGEDRRIVICIRDVKNRCAQKNIILDWRKRVRYR